MTSADTSSGTGGFGGGGGGRILGAGSAGGFGGGDGGIRGGGGGAGFGGAIFIERGGTLNLEGNVDFILSEAIPGVAGTNASPGTIAGTDIYMMSGSFLNFDITSDVILQHPIEGNQGIETPNPPVLTGIGGLKKTGTALLSLIGDNTYTGTTTVDEGELEINGSVVTDVKVGPGGLLTGSFSATKDATGLNGGNLENRGTVSPGGTDIGEIILDGEFSQIGNGSRLIVDVTPVGNVNDTIMNATKATLAGTLEVVANPGNYIKGTTYLVIDAPTFGSTFDDVVVTGDFGSLLDIKVLYDSVVILITETELFKKQIIDSGPPSDVAKCIEAANIVPDSDFAVMVEKLGTLSNEAVNEALTSISAVRYGAVEWINARNNSYAADILSQHLFELCCSPRNCCSSDCNANAWVSVFGNIMDNKKPLNNLRKYNADAVGMLTGADWCCGDRFTYGAALGYTHTYLLWRENGGRGDINSYYGALYGSCLWDCASLDLSFLGGGSDNDLKRNITFADVARKANGDFWSFFFTGHIGLKAYWRYCANVFEPFALFDYHYYNHETFTESGANSLNLKVLSKTQHMMRREGGIVWRYDFDCGNYCIAPYLGYSWLQDLPFGKSKQPASFKGQSCVIDALSYDSSVKLESPQAGFKWTHCSGGSISLGYKGLYNKKTRINEIEGRLEWVF